MNIGIESIVQFLKHQTQYLNVNFSHHSGL